MKWLEIVIILLYIAALVVIIVEFSGMWALATVLLIILIICSLQKAYFEKLYEKLQERKERVVEIVMNKIDAFSNGIDAIKTQIEQNTAFMESRFGEIQNFNKIEMDKTYRELTRKILDVENKLNTVKRMLAGAYGIIDERLDKVEAILNIKEETEYSKTT